MAFTTESLAKTAFKKLFGLSHTGNAKEPGNEALAVRQFLSADEFPSEAIPATAAAVASRILDCTNSTTGQADSELVLDLDPSSNGDAYFVEVPATGHDLENYTNPLTGSAYAPGDRVSYIIPKKYGSTWRPILYDNGVEVAPSASNDWFLDEFGVVTSETDLSLGSTGTLACYVYVGNLGGILSIAKSGDTALIGDVTLSEGSNITLTQAGQDISIAAAGGGSATFQHRWTANGPFRVDTDVDGGYISDSAFTISGVRLWRGTAGSSSSTIVDIHKNGTTMYTTQGNRPTILFSDGDNKIDATLPDVTSISAGDIITMDIDQIEAGNPADLTLLIQGS